MKKILLTGGSGMVGRNLLEHPDTRKYDILCPTSKDLDLCNFDEVNNYVKKNKPDMVIHAAGKVGGIQANIKQPVDFLTINLDMGRNIVLAARVNEVKELLNLGSSCMYPKDRNDSLTEDLILKGELEPTNEGYALAKIVTARLCEYIAKEDYNYQYKTLIPCNLYGRHDKFNPKNSHLIPAIIHKIFQAKKNNEATVEIWGDGTARREFMYAEDLAQAILKSIENMELIPQYMNIGLGYDYTINEYYKTVAEVLEYDGKFSHDITKPVGMARKLVNIDKQQKWGWKPQYDLKSGIKKACEFYIESLKHEL